jgi:hypothetical protein
VTPNRVILSPMWDACKLLWSLFLGLFRSRASLEAENLALRQQIIVLQRTAPKRLRFNTIDRMIFVGLYRLFPDLRDALAVVWRHGRDSSHRPFAQTGVYYGSEGGWNGVFQWSDQ